MRKIYLDVCCVNRPFDDQSQDRIRLEAEAIFLILLYLYAGEWEWIGSEVMNAEIERTVDVQRKAKVYRLTAGIKDMIIVGPGERERAKYLEELGFTAFDALHLACAESGGAEVFLTTDDRFQRRADRYAKQLRIRVANPLDWFEEVIAQ